MKAQFRIDTNEPTFETARMCFACGRQWHGEARCPHCGAEPMPEPRISAEARTASRRAIEAREARQ